MTNQEINQAIAEACGWTRNPEAHHTLRWIDPKGNDGRRVPDYCRDLNAMHEAEKMLSVEQKSGCARTDYHDGADYQDSLHDVVTRNREGLTVGLVWYLTIHATARERAEAFLRTLNLWKS